MAIKAGFCNDVALAVRWPFVQVGRGKYRAREGEWTRSSDEQWVGIDASFPHLHKASPTELIYLFVSPPEGITAWA